MTDQSRILSLTEVGDLARRALAGCGAHGDQLEWAVDSIVEAECDGIQTVGLGYLPLYCGHLQVGKINRGAVPAKEQVAPAALRVDADAGFAHAAYAAAEHDFYALAESQGLAAMAVINSYSAGVVGWFVQRIAAAGLIGLGFANSPSAVAPAPGAAPFFGTNPLAFAIPRNGAAPVVADMATSQVAFVSIKAAAAEGRPIPEGWGYDASGQITTDPAAVLDGGSLAPMGGYKGMALGLLVDVLSGVLTGPNCSFTAPMFKDNTGGEPRVGQLFIALSPERIAPGGTAVFAERLEHMLGALAAEPGVRLPGDRRHEFRARAESDGVAVPLALIDRLEAFAAGG